jgi:hypothetical protein
VTSEPDWRRLLPPPRRRPGLVAIVVRWRVEVLLVLAVGAMWQLGGGRVVELLAGVTALGLAATATGRAVAVVAWQLLAVPHRVRSAFVQAGVASRQGRLPLIFWVRPDGAAVVVSAGLRSGITVRDLRDAVPVILGACGATHVEIVPRPSRPDRVTVVVVRPRRGLW